MIGRCGSRPGRGVIALVASAIAVGLPASLQGADPLGNVNVPALEDAAESIVSGLTVTFQNGDTTDVRSARLIALTVPEKSPPTPFLPAGPFKATWEGNLNLSLRGEYSFSAACSGNLKVIINGTPVLEVSGAGADPADIVGPVRLKKGVNSIRAEYESPEHGDAFVRLYWKGREFPREPVPPMVFTHNENTGPERLARRIREGRALVGTLRCLKCHDPGEMAPAAGAGLPELAIDAPSFADIGGRLNSGWMARWINDPHAGRSDTSMPRLFHDGLGAPAADARALNAAAFLATLGAPAKKEAAAPSAELASEGGKLFATLGCVGCHSASDTAAAPEEHRRVSLRHVQAKWQSHALEAYLRAPHTHYAWNPMPDFRLSKEEAERLTAFLFTRSSEAVESLPERSKADIEEGRKVVESAGCLNCHSAPGSVSTLKAPALAEMLKGAWSRGCLATDNAARGAAPDFKLTSSARESLLAFAATDWSSLKQEALPEFAERQIAALRCGSCHSRDGQQDVWSKLETETAPLIAAAPAAVPASPEGEQPATTYQAPPQLTWIGEKLQTGWAADFIAGTIVYKPRHWMLARMPAFVMPAQGIAAGLALEHGFSLAAQSHPPVDVPVAEVGRRLLGPDAGYSCTTCHSLGDQPASAPFEAPAVNFQWVSERLRHEYYHRWMLNPPRIEPDTRMPKFADEEGRTPLTDIYEGDANKQWDAIWEFLRSLKPK